MSLQDRMTKPLWKIEKVTIDQKVFQFDAETIFADLAEVYPACAGEFDTADPDGAFIKEVKDVAAQQAMRDGDYEDLLFALRGVVKRLLAVRAPEKIAYAKLPEWDTRGKKLQEAKRAEHNRRKQERLEAEAKRFEIEAAKAAGLEVEE